MNVPFDHFALRFHLTLRGFSTTLKSLEFHSFALLVFQILALLLQPISRLLDQNLDGDIAPRRAGIRADLCDHQRPSTRPGT